MSNEIDELKALVVELSDNLNHCMAQQAALQHGLYALMVNVTDRQAVANALTICAENFMTHSLEADLPVEMMETYQGEIAELMDSLEDLEE
ncbi:MAG: hypothetical protein PHN76_09140 [Advenella sp.]|uniref:hypothetical protein n=1 Tax=Advenella sp. TaxID=1872388 RepID=UPI00258566E3|nr:hypothetical protein [Advenella sp.]MDD3758315.1 hypothetical protein [Advenella sp.]